jgi:hypothetical protein
MEKVQKPPLGMKINEHDVEIKLNGHVIRIYLVGDYLRIVTNMGTLLVQPEESRSLFITTKVI